MYFNKVTSTVMSAMFLLLILSSVNLSSVKLVSAATGDLVNYNNNFDIYTSPSDPNKDSAMQNADCVVNFMQTYVYAASSADSCTNASTSTPAPTTPTDQAQTPIQNQGYPATTTMTTAPTSTTTTAAPTPIAAAEGPQTGVTDQSDSVGVVRVVDNNTNGATPLPVQSTSTTTSPQNNADDDDDDNDNDDKDAKGKDDDDDDDNDDDDKDAKGKDDDDDNDNDNDNDDKDAKGKDDDDDDDNDKEIETKVYNENTVTKEERKLLLTTCFERAYDKGDYLSTKEIVKCAENYNS